MNCRTAAAFAALVLVLSPPSAHAQYMYLDSNGDGVHNASDIVRASGITTVDVWFVTNENRDGSPASCASEPGTALTINSYEFFLRTEGGIVAFGPFESVLAYPTSFGNFKNTTDLYAGRAGNILPPGRYLLGRLDIETLSGNPSLRFVEGSSVNPPGYTSFGCRCPGADYDNTMKLGQEWFDADGLAAEGVSSYAPWFVAMNDIYMVEGASASYTIAATDADSDSLQLSVGDLPAYATWLIASSLPGRVEARLSLAPTFADAGTRLIVIACSDGTLESTYPLKVTVRDVNPAPVFDAMSNVTLPLGSVADQTVTARDADQQPLTIRFKSGPSFVTLGPTEATQDGYRALARIAPGPSDAGDWQVRLDVTDGTSTAVGGFRVYAFDSSLYHPPSIDSIPDFTLAEGDTALHELNVRDPEGNSSYTYLVQSPPFVQIVYAFWYGKDSLYITPGPLHAGVWEATVVASESYYGGPTFQDRETFGITVIDRPFPPLVQTAPARPCVEQGEVYSVVVRISDPDGDPFTVVFGPPPPWGTAILESATSCRYELSPTSDVIPGTIYLTAHTMDGAGTEADALAAVSVATIGDCPRGGGGFASGPDFTLSCEAGAPVTVVAGSRVRFEGVAAVEPIGTLLRYGWGFGDGVTALGRVLEHEYGAGGVYQAILTVTVSNTTHTAKDTVLVTVREALTARAFVEREDTPIVLRSARPLVTLRVERVGEEYALEDIVPGSLCLRSAGHGEVDSISAQSAKGARVEDRDRNGAAEMAVSFSKEDLRRLFADVRGKRTTPARLEGRLANGAQVRAPLDLEILGSPSRAVTVWPNPMNPRGVIAFEAKRAGQAVVRLYDVSGRLVRTLFEARVEPGEVQVPIDGKDERGRALASGVYYYRITTGDDTWQGRATILK